jgi:dolichyl-phosphate-mannose--protein O-mannosyl transferase
LVSPASASGVAERRWRALIGALVTATLASALYLPRLGAPRGAVWDESYYLTTLQRQVERHAQFASHPPLGFLLLSIAPRVGAARPQDAALASEKTVAGQAIAAGYDFARARLGSALAGILGAVAFYALMLALTQRLGLALALGNLFTFENAFLVQFRAAQLDSFLMLFSLLALLAFVMMLRRADKRSFGLEIAFGAAVGLAMMVKLIGAWLVLAGPLLLIRQCKARGPRPLASKLLESLTSTIAMSMAFLGAIVLVFSLQTADATRGPNVSSAAGAHDLGFMSHAYRDWLEGRGGSFPAAVVAAAQDDLAYGLNDLVDVPRADPNGSSPLEWPFMRRTISYRWDSDGVVTRYVQLVGNPVGWTLGLAGLILGPIIAFGARRDDRRALAVAILVLWAEVMLVHLWLAQTRVMYLYHYFPGLILSWCLVALAASEALDRFSARNSPGKTVIALAVLAHLAAFWFWSPMTFGQGISASACRARDILTVQVTCRPARPN